MMRFALSFFLGLAAFLMICPSPSQGVICNLCQDAPALQALAISLSTPQGRQSTSDQDKPCPVGEPFDCINGKFGQKDRTVCSTLSENGKIITKTCTTEAEMALAGGSKSNCLDQPLPDGKKLKKCFCKGDKCNSETNGGMRSTFSGADGTFLLSLSFAGFAVIFGQRVW